MQTRSCRVSGWFTRTTLATSILLGSVCLLNADDPAPPPADGTTQTETPSAPEVPAAATSPDAEAATGEADYYELMRVFVDTFQEIDQNYVKEVDRRKLINAAVRGMLAELDPYSDYIAPDDLEHFTEAISQEFGGVGIRVNWDKQARSIEIISPLAGSPAYKAGIKTGDRIVEINGKPVKDFPAGREIDSAIELLRGKAGEKVEVGILRPDAKDVEKFMLTREMIQLDTVLGDQPADEGKWKFLIDEEKKIGYLRLTHFTSRSAAEFKEALKTLKKQGMKGLIVDLRYNPGGLLDAAVEIADLFIEQGLIVSTDGRNSAHRTWSAKKFGTYTGFPIAVLINNYSASASEILSASLQDHDRAVVIGERSWGKGSVQDVIDLEDGKSALKLTTASYHRPSGKNIHRFPNSKEADEWGVTPDEGYKIEYSLKEHQEYQAYRHLRDMPGNKSAEVSFDDRQLAAAIKYIAEEILKTDQAPAEAPAEKVEEPAAPVEEGKKAADGRHHLPFFAVPKNRAG